MDFEEKYKRKVDYNIEYLRGIKGSIKEKFDIKKYKEPDDIIGTKELQGINVWNEFRWYLWNNENNRV